MDSFNKGPLLSDDWQTKEDNNCFSFRLLIEIVAYLNDRENSLK